MGLAFSHSFLIAFYFQSYNFRLLARWLPVSMSLPHPKFLKPVASSPDQVVRLPCHVLGLFYLLCLLDTLLLRFIQSGPSDQDSDLGATGILHTLALLDCPLLTTRFLQIPTSLFMVRLDNIFRLLAIPYCDVSAPEVNQVLFNTPMYKIFQINHDI